LGESTVTELAYRLGFTQLGRLAGEYRYAFGEPPSATLARPYQGTHQCYGWADQHWTAVETALAWSGLRRAISVGVCPAGRVAQDGLGVPGYNRRFARPHDAAGGESPLLPTEVHPCAAPDDIPVHPHRLAIGSALLLILLLWALLFVTDTAFSVLERLNRGPAWFLYLYGAGFLAVVAAGATMLWRLLRRTAAPRVEQYPSGL